MPDPTAGEAAVASVEEACPKCGAPRGPRQEYCIECGLRLPQTTGILAALRRSLIRRFGWYPGDWVWTSLVGLIVAIAGAAVAIALTSNGGGAGTTIVATTPPPTTTRSTTAPSTSPEPTTAKATTTATTTSAVTTTVKAPTTTATTSTVAAANGATVWPAGKRGWTIVLGSYPVSAGRAAPTAAARRAARSLSQVGVLDSSDWTSLHPGYYVVFSGIYSSEPAAQAAVSHVRTSGFATAYVRPIAA